MGFDGSSCRGWRAINESDMVLMPDSSSAKMDPFSRIPTISFICDVVMPETLTPYDRDPRQIAKKAIAYLNSTGIADTAYFGPEAEFFIFDDVRYSQINSAVFIKSIPTPAPGTAAATRAAAILDTSRATKRLLRGDADG